MQKSFKRSNEEIVSIEDFIHWFDSVSDFIIIRADEYGDYQPKMLSLETVFKQRENMIKQGNKDTELDRE